VERMGKKFWETEPEFWDTVNEVGLRNVYFCSTYAARLMVPRGQLLELKCRQWNI
jgi:dehydrogenase/reductase SDR family protein 1